MKTCRKRDYLSYFLLLVFPLFDMFGLSIAGTNFRLTELYILLFSAVIIIDRTRDQKMIIKKGTGYNVFLALLTNFMVSLVGVLIWHQDVDTTFAIKYLIRNIIYILFITACLVKKKKPLCEGDIEFLAKWTIKVSAFCFALLFLFGNQIYMNHLIKPVDGLRVSILGVSMIRFSASTFEPGLAFLLLALPLYYFTRTYEKNKLYFWITVCLLLTTYSTTAFAVLTLNFALLLWEKHKVTKSFITNVALSLLLIIIGVFVVFNNASIADKFWYQINKILGFFTGGKTGTLLWTSNDRLNQMQIITRHISDGNLWQIIWGRGTGEYTYYIARIKSGIAMTNAEEAYNVYLSSLSDRGIVGLGFVAFIILDALKGFRNSSLPIRSLKWIVLVHAIGWVIMGNFWLYTFWTAIGFMILYSKPDMEELNK